MASCSMMGWSPYSDIGNAGQQPTVIWACQFGTRTAAHHGHKRASHPPSAIFACCHAAACWQPREVTSPKKVASTSRLFQKRETNSTRQTRLSSSFPSSLELAVDDSERGLQGTPRHPPKDGLGSLCSLKQHAGRRRMAVAAAAKKSPVESDEICDVAPPLPTPTFPPTPNAAAEHKLTSKEKKAVEDCDGGGASVKQLPFKTTLKLDDGQSTELDFLRMTLQPLEGIDFSPETFAISMVYFVQGVLGLARLAVTFFLKDEFGLDPAETAVLTGLSALPWLIKPLYGFLSDNVPLFGYRRRSYLAACGLAGTVAWAALATVVDSEAAAVAMILLSSLSVAVSDVVVDSMVVERARGKPPEVAGSLQSLCWASSAVGGIISAYFSGSLVEAYGPRYVFGVTALLPLVTCAVGFLVHEKRIFVKQPLTEFQRGGVDRAESSNRSAMGSTWSRGGKVTEPVSGEMLFTEEAAAMVAKKGAAEKIVLGPVVEAEAEILERNFWGQIRKLWEVAKEPAILLPTVFIFIWQASPHSETAMFYYTTNVLGFGPEFLGRVRLVTSVASLAGIALFNFRLRSVPLRQLLFWTNIVGVLLGSTQLLLVTGTNRWLGISDEFFLLGDSLILTVLGQISFMPILVLAARICPPGVEATLFAALMSISNGAGVLGGILGAGLTKVLGVTATEFSNLALLLFLCNTSSLLALPFLQLLPDEYSEEQTGATKDQ